MAIEVSRVKAAKRWGLRLRGLISPDSSKTVSEISSSC